MIRAIHIPNQTIYVALITLATLLSSACSMLTTPKDGAPRKQVNLSNIPDAQPRIEPRSKYGNPHSYSVDGERYYVLDSSKGYRQTGIASWYGTKFHGQRTSSGEVYDMYAMTAAHKTLPLPTYVKVTNLTNHRSVVVKVNDRGPFVDDRLIDLSYVAAQKLDILGHGTAHVEVSAIDPAEQFSTAQAATTQVSMTTVSPRQAAVPAPRPVSNAAAVESTNNETYNFYYLQIGAFSEFSNAEHALAKLIFQTSQPAHINMGTTAENTPVYRVRLGPYQEHENIKAIEAQLEQYGYKYTHVVDEPLVTD